MHNLLFTLFAPQPFINDKHHGVFWSFFLLEIIFSRLREEPSSGRRYGALESFQGCNCTEINQVQALK